MRLSFGRIKVSDLLLCVILLLVYLKIHGIGIVYIGAFLASTLVFFRYRSAWKIPVKYIAILLLVVFVSEIGSAIFLGSWGVSGIDHIKYMIYHLVSFSIVIAAIYLFQRGGRETGTKLAFIVMALFILIGALEAYGPIKPFVDTVRMIYTSEASLYEATERDIRQYGAIRPTVFTSEPSSVGNFFGSLMIFYLCIGTPGKARAFLSLCFLAAGLYIFRTPTLIVYAIIGFGLFLCKRGRISAGYAIVVACLVSVIFLPGLLWLYQNRISNLFLSEFVSTGSYLIRQITPIISAFEVVGLSPLFGGGAAYFEVARDTSYALISANHGYYTYERMSLMSSGQYVTNAIWEYWGTYGILGGSVILWVISRALRDLGINHVPIVLLASFALWTNHAGLVLAFSWIHVILISMAFQNFSASGNAYSYRRVKEPKHRSEGFASGQLS